MYIESHLVLLCMSVSWCGDPEKLKFSMVVSVLAIKSLDTFSEIASTSFAETNYFPLKTLSAIM